MQVLLHKFPALFVFRTFEKDTEIRGAILEVDQRVHFFKQTPGRHQVVPACGPDFVSGELFRSSYTAAICRLFIPPPPSPLPFFPVTLFASASTC